MHRREQAACISSASHVQTSVNETESKLQTINTQSSSLKVLILTYLSSANAALSTVVVSEIEISW